jgi:hypothetical protein
MLINVVINHLILNIHISYKPLCVKKQRITLTRQIKDRIDTIKRHHLKEKFKAGDKDFYKIGNRANIKGNKLVSRINVYIMLMVLLKMATTG